MGSKPQLITLSDWRAAQKDGNGLERLYDLAAQERLSNTTTHAWISIASNEQIKQQWECLQSRTPETSSLSLHGVPFAVKDNIDVEGFTTTAACPLFSREPASSDAHVVAKLKAAGAIVLGKTNLDQFATGLVGTRSPYGVVPNSFDSSRVSGGSSSGSGVVVARGVVPFLLGTDTAGSGRVPAGLNNIVGLKPTRGALSARGVVPACRSLDCVSIFALTVGDAETVLSAAEGYDVHDAYSRDRPVLEHSPPAYGTFGTGPLGSTPSLAICASPPWFGKDDQFPAYDVALEKARHLGWQLTPVDFSNLFKLAKLLYEGPWVAERYAAIQEFIESCAEDDMNPTVRGIILKARNFSAADAYSCEYTRQEIAREVQESFKGFDGILVPTSPTFPTLEELGQRPVEENSPLGTYTNFVNFLDWSALSIPSGFRPDGLPFGVTLISSQWQEAKLLELARRWFGEDLRLLGATRIEGKEKEKESIIDANPSGYIPITVVGAHLTGFPLNKDLVSRGGKLKTTTTTSSNYRLYALKSASGPPNPGIKRVVPGEEGCEIDIEVWNLPEAALASFMTTIPSPLGIGRLEIKDGSWVHGFICESRGLHGATDITEFGGWRGYMNHLQSSSSSSSQWKSISTVLVANRGEIAVRIIRTLRKTSLRSVAIYSDIDADAMHVKEADVALRLEGNTITETYLNIDKVLELAKSASVDAIIPGYGFLSENSEFATAVEEAGMVWVGPTPQQMSELGLKHRARAIAAEAQVQTVPGCEHLLVSLEQAFVEAESIGYPLMLKSTAGGGGIGLRHCEDAASLKDAFEGVQRQASANFGNAGVFLERFIQRARHIEVQILGDGTGRVVAAGERDCSLQRRHQKVVEESPAFAIPIQIRDEIRAAAVRLASSVKYRNVGTIEFIFDLDTRAFYFLEVNTRLQVEHPITEAVTGLDLVECMLKIADERCDDLFSDTTSNHITMSGASLEVRVYAESPLQGFRPCAGKITKLVFPEDLRVDTWIVKGTEVSTSYDPLIAKLIATGENRQEALLKMANGLAATRIEGVQTNLDYLKQIVASELVQTGDYTTKSLDSFKMISPSAEVVDSGALSMIQDYPGRIGYWSAGVPPSGPMDNYSHRLANRLVNNKEDAATIECTIQGSSLRFHCSAIIAMVGGETEATVDGDFMPLNQGFRVFPGQTLRVGLLTCGYRLYIAIRGGIQVPKVMGSRSTFELGKPGGHLGRKLQAGDLVPLDLETGIVDAPLPSITAIPIPKGAKAQWSIRVVPGPHGAPDMFTRDGLSTLFEGEWKVHHNSNRLGVRLTGPRPEWARKTGGEAGLHPSNVHDSPYSIGSVSFTGDEAVVLTCDGPSLGGFVVFCVVIEAYLWKMGQVKPGDSIRFKPVDIHQALQLERELNQAIELLEEPTSLSVKGVNSHATESELHIIVGLIELRGQKITARQAGDRAMLLEFDTPDSFDLKRSFQIFFFCEEHCKSPIPGVKELTPGVCTLHIYYSRGLSPETMFQRITSHVVSYAVPTQVPSRTFRLPLAFDDAVSRAAVERYAATIRSEAPWLPSNASFLEKLNGIDDISSIFHQATFLVLGLGDVFLGAPCAVPLDPRHRLFGTKHNPSRSFTPKRSVGIGGQYMCIYLTDSPGGYQLIGRTVEIWDSKLACPGASDLISGLTNGHKNKEQVKNPWMFRVFDQICFYPVTEAELDSKPIEELVLVQEDVLDLVAYDAWLLENQEDIAASKMRQKQAIASAPFLDELVRPYEVEAKHSGDSEMVRSPGDDDTRGEGVKAMMPGRCYRCVVKKGDVVNKGDVLLYMESSKMEVEIHSPVSGTCIAIKVKEGDLVEAYDDLVVIE